MAYVEGLHYQLLWVEDLIRETRRLDMLCCVIGGGKPRAIEVLRMDAEEARDLS